MNRLLKPSWIFCLAGIFALCAANALAQQYIFTNDNVANSGNRTTALSVNSKGAVKLLKLLKTYPTGERVRAAVTSRCLR